MSCLCGIIVDSLVGKVIERTVEPVCRQVGYIFNYEDNIASLSIEFTRLSAEKNGMQQQVQSKLNNVEVILADVECWMGEANHVIVEVEKILKDDGHAKAKCSFRSFPNLVRRHGLSRRAKKMAASIVKVRADIPKGPIACSQVPTCSVEVMEGYGAFESRNLIINEIMDALRKLDVQVVGLYGMGGIGKTMLAKEVSRRARLEKLFEVDAMVSVSQDQKPIDIQQQIAENLGLTLHEKTVPVRAKKLRERLRQEQKNILIILDDVWDKLDLQEIGVSFENHQKGCKILLTSRSAAVCNIMKAEKSTFNLQVLTSSEAANLFNQNVGELATSPNFKNLANEIVEECAGLPLAIVIVASALKHIEQEVWEDVLRELKTCSPSNIEGMVTKVYPSVMVSYNHLPNEDARNLLLLCSLHAEDEDILIEDLVKYGMDISWFHNNTTLTTLKDARSSVYHLVVKLKERSLLLDGKEEGWVKVHDVIRDACLSFASNNKCMHFIRDIPHFKKFIENEKLVEEATRISLPLETINQLPQKVKWPHLKLLLLRNGNTRGEILDEHCFKEMKDLRVLYLFNIQVKQTCFLSSLQKLQTLFLRSCVLGDIAPIGELNNLKILDLSSSSFSKLPKEIGQLTQLQLLDLNSCFSLIYVEPHVLSKLKNLEELHMKGSYGAWRVGVNSEGVAILAELNELDTLTTLCVTVTNVDCVPKFWLSNKMDLEKYEICIGQCGTYGEPNTSKVLILDHVKGHHVKVHGLERFIRTAKTLYLKEFEDLNDVFELDNIGFPHVEHFLIECNKGVRYFINPRNPCPVFLSLKSLVLDKMMNLEKICHGKLLSGSFGKLKEVTVNECVGLKSLFSFSIARLFEQIQVSFCPELQVIGSHENEHESQNAINVKSCELETLLLVDLPKLTRFFWPEQEINYISDRGDGLFNSKVVFSKLRKMKFSGIEVGKLWLDELHEVSFMKNLRNLKVTNCSGLSYLSSFEVAKSLELLESLTLSDLEALKVVIVVKNQMDGVERMEKNLFPKLHTLKLINLSNMVEFCSQCFFEFPSLKVLRIKECLKVADLDLIGRSSNLEILDISCSSFMKLPRGIERQVKSLYLSFCKFLHKFQPDVDSKFIFHKEFESHVTWGVEGVSSASLSELKSLSQLTGLFLCVPDFSYLPKDFFSEMWMVCRITTNKGSCVSFLVYSYSSKLQLHLKSGEIIVWECGLQVLLKRSEELLIDGLEDDMDDIVSELDPEGFPLLREFRLECCYGVRCLVNSIRHSSTAAFISLEKLFLFNLISLETICHGELLSGSFGKLTRLEVVRCASLKSLFPISVATQLGELTLMNCEALEAIFTVGREDNDLAFTELQSLSFTKLTRLEVVNCASLKSLFPISFATQLVELTVENCEALEVIFTIERDADNDLAFPELQSLSLGKLTRLEVVRCASLKSLFPISVATQLGELLLMDCEALEAIFTVEREDNDLAFTELPSLSFTKLTRLKVGKCARLKSLVPISFATQLVELTVVDCEALEAIFTFKREDDIDLAFTELQSLSFGKLEKVSVFNCVRLKSLFPIHVATQLMELVVHDCEAMEAIFTIEREDDNDLAFTELQGLSFRKLTRLEVVKCASLKNLFPISVATQLVELTVMDCEAMEAIFPIEREDNDPVFTELQSLSLNNLPGLVYFYSKLKTTFTSRWKEPSEEELGISLPLFDAKVQMPNLSELKLEKIGCKKIWHHQPSPIFNNLKTLEVSDCLNLKRLMPCSMVTNLKSLKVRNCENMQELISTEKEEESIISFNKLETLLLKNLRSLRRFNAVGTINFPSLSKMTLKGCFKLTTFIPGSTKAPQRETFFGGKVNLPKLDRLRVDNCEILDEIFDLKDQSRFDKLENLYLDNELVIPKPMHMCGKNVHQGKGKVFQDLVRLSINRCNGLKSLATPSVYFHYLIELKVSECNGLMKLFSSSTIKGMVSLQQITISKCKGMTEIIGNDHEGVVESEIVLEQLRDLELCDLPNLRCFYSGNSTITFPYLDALFVSRCFEMKTFSHGIVKSPFLDSIITYNGQGMELDWEGNINSTIQKVYEKGGRSLNQVHEPITSEKDTTMGNNEDELSTELTELSGEDQVKRDSWKEKEQATKSSSSGSSSAF